MSNSKISIKWHLFAYIAMFTAVMLLILWLIQVVFLQSFYRISKINDVKATADSIAATIENADSRFNLMDIAHSSDSVINITDLKGKQLDSSSPPDSPDYYSSEYKELIKKAKSYGGIYLKWVNQSKSGIQTVRPASSVNKNSPSPNQSNGIAYVKIVKLTDGTQVAIFLNTDIAPVDATVMTIRTQLVCVTFIMLLLALFLAFLISRRISKPIVKMNRAAKDLALGNYDITFDGKGYKEISELGGSLNYAARELGKTENLRRELISNISHDLRTPLTMITGYAEVIRDIPGEDTPENVQVIIDEASRLSSLVNDVLDLSKLESSTEELKFEAFNLTESIGSILNRYKKLTEQEGFTIKFLHNSGVYINGDELRISQVVYNLVNNALTYTGKDKLVIVRQNICNNRVKIEVIDTGEGIPEEKLPMIWDRYYKVEEQHKRAAMGNGLGLSIVKSILEKHHALYGVQSTVGQGSVFWFEIETVQSTE